MKRLIAIATVLLSTAAAGALLVSAPKASDAPQYRGAVGDQRESAVAHGAGVSLVVWSSGGNIVGARVNASNELLDEGGVLLATGERPAVAFDGSNFLVAYQRNNGGSGWDIEAVRVTPQAVVLDTSPLKVVSAPNSQIAPAVAFDNGQYLVVWQDGRSGGTTFEFIFGARISPHGALLDPNGILISQGPNSRTHPAVAAGAGNFLVVWTDGRVSGDPRIYGARVSPQGTVLEPGGTALTPTATNVTEPTVGYDGANFWVAYPILSSFTSYSGQIFANRFAPDLSAVGSRLTISSSSWSRTPSMACGGDHCLLTWHYDNQSTTTVYGARVRNDGTVLTSTSSPHYFGTSPTGVIAGTQRRFGVAWTGSSFAATWHEANRSANPGGRGTDVYLRRLNTDGSFPDTAAVRVSTGANRQQNPSVAFNGSSYLVVWTDDRADQQDIYAARFDADGNLLDPVGIAVSTAANEQATPVVAAIGSDFLVVWSDRRSGTSWDLFAARIGADGTVKDPGGIAVSNASGDQSEPAVACGVTECLAAWRDTRTTTNGDVYFARLSPAGSVLDLGGKLLETLSGVSSSPAVAFDGTQYLGGWVTGTSVYARRLDTAGNFVDSVPVRLTTNDSPYELQAASAQGSFLLAWQFSASSLRAVQFTPAGTATPVTVASVSSSFYIRSVTMASDGQTALLLWEQSPNSSPNAANTELRARHLGPDAQPIDPTSFVVRSLPTINLDNSSPS
ncbi:MAG: hypothetical protein ACK4N5_07140, partial [Myxococcales bacterium]